MVIIPSGVAIPVTNAAGACPDVTPEASSCSLAEEPIHHAQEQTIEDIHF